MSSSVIITNNNINMQFNKNKFNLIIIFSCNNKVTIKSIERFFECARAESNYRLYDGLLNRIDFFSSGGT